MNVFLLFFIVISTQSFKITKNEVEVEVQFKPYPSRTLKFEIEGEELTNYQFYLPLNESKQISQFSCFDNEKEMKFEMKENEQTNKLELNIELNNKQKNTFTCKFIQKDCLENYPKKKRLNENYKFLITTHLCPISNELNCKTKFVLNAINTISVTGHRIEDNINRIRFAPLKNEKEFKFETYHFSASDELLTYSKLKKTVNINKENVYVQMEINDMKNNGAELKDEFFRGDFRMGGVFLDDFSVKIEKDSSNLEYRDSTGLITTGELHSFSGYSSIDIPPRYPLLGGWKTTYEVNYEFPVQNVVQQIGEQQRFSLPLKVDFRGISEEVEIDVVLPEGSTVTSINHPENYFIKMDNYDQKSFGTYFTKPVVKIVARNVDASQLAGSVEIYYKENPLAEKTKNTIVACLASSIIIVFLLYAKIINH